MDILIKWVTQIILFLLLALVTDLILPSSSMKKYIKLVVGMLLILVFLQPLFQLFNVDIEEIFSRQMTAVERNSDQLKMENSIENQKKEIQASQRAYILEQMAVQLRNGVEEELITEHGVTISNLDFTFNQDNSLTLETLEKLTVILTSSVQEGQNKEQSDRNIEEIVIDINQDKQENEDSQKPSLAKVKRQLSSSWEIPEDKLNVVWEGGS